VTAIADAPIAGTVVDRKMLMKVSALMASGVLSVVMALVAMVTKNQAHAIDSPMLEGGG
jgi:hypothetical protein